MGLLDPINFCLEDSGLEKPDVHEVVLFGGSARVPRIRRAIREFFYGKTPREVLRPDHAAVLGAAAYVAALHGQRTNSVPRELMQVKVRAVTSWSLTVEDDEESVVGNSMLGWHSKLSDEEARESIPSDGVVPRPNRTQTAKGIGSVRDPLDEVSRPVCMPRRFPGGGISRS